MKIATRVLIDMATMQVIEKDEYDYEGPVARCGGGPSSLQKQQAQDSANLNKHLVDIGDQYNAREQAAYNDIAPFSRSRMANGLPFFNQLTDSAGGINSRAWAPAYQELNQRLAGQPDGPSGSRQAAFSALGANRARAFDDSLTGSLFANDAAKVQGAELLRQQQVMSDPMRAYAGANQGMQGVYSAQNLGSPGFGGILGGIMGAGLGGLLGNPGIFGGKKGG